jgi:pyruvate, water dikinase
MLNHSLFSLAYLLTIGVREDFFMSWLSEQLCALFRTATEVPSGSESKDKVRDLFKTRYWNFKLLLDLNQRCMEIVADMEHQLMAGQGYGMALIRAQATSLSVCVFQIIQKLESLASGKYSGLHQAFAAIQERIDAELKGHGEEPNGPLVMDLSVVGKDDADATGSKMAVLGEIANKLQLSVPEGFVVCSSAYQLFMQHNALQQRINQQLQSVPLDDLEMLYEVSQDIQEAIVTAELPDELRRTLDQALRRLENRHGSNVLVSMRSSALGEDGLHLSFAGQYTTELNVSLREAPQAYKRVLAGMYSARAIAYRKSHGVRDEDIRMSVGCMLMVEAKAGGVTYSRDPGNYRAERVLINAAPGLGDRLVDGTVSPQSLVLRRVQGEWSIVSAEDEDSLKADLARIPRVLDSSKAAEAAALSRVLEDHFGSPQDVEWALDRQDRFILLQSRPLRTMNTRPAAQERFDTEEGLPEPLLFGGVCASSGVAFGPARVVASLEDALRVQPGEVLVVEHAMPCWAVFLEKAAAVVSDCGGVASHLATVAREFGIPALFDTGQGTSSIQDGALVTVDADGYRVYPGRVEQLLAAHAVVKPSLMHNSPVHAILERVLTFITPLNLVRPEAAEFVPEQCRTYHDIIRFCHEQAVVEMFTLGLDKGFQDRVGRQLQADVPMQWWIVDLGGGIAAHQTEQCVMLKDVCSRPFMAVWEGIVAVPWQGPPSPNLGGFFSVMANSAMNTDLDVCGPSRMQQKNCAFVSQNFCSLNCRFGYHFSVIQAFIGERIRENYIRFSFQGGATDRSRMAQRLELIRNVLEESRFQMDIREDTLNAQIECCEDDHMLKMLKALGYLIIHTRQIDMVMNDPGKVQYYQEVLRDTVRGMIET